MAIFQHRLWLAGGLSLALCALAPPAFAAGTTVGGSSSPVTLGQPSDSVTTSQVPVYGQVPVYVTEPVYGYVTIRGTKPVYTSEPVYQIVTKYHKVTVCTNKVYNMKTRHWTCTSYSTKRQSYTQKVQTGTKEVQTGTEPTETQVWTQTGTQQVQNGTQRGVVGYQTEYTVYASNTATATDVRDVQAQASKTLSELVSATQSDTVTVSETAYAKATATVSATVTQHRTQSAQDQGLTASASASSTRTQSATASVQHIAGTAKTTLTVKKTPSVTVTATGQAARTASGSSTSTGYGNGTASSTNRGTAISQANAAANSQAQAAINLTQLAQFAHANAYATADAAAESAADANAKHHLATAAAAAQAQLNAQAKHSASTTATADAQAQALATATGYAHHNADVDAAKAAKTAATKAATKAAASAASAKALRWATALVTDMVDQRAITNTVSQITADVSGLEDIATSNLLPSTSSGGALTIGQLQHATTYAQYTPQALTGEVAQLVTKAQQFLKTADVDQRYAEAFASEPGAPASETQFAATETTLVTAVKKLLATEQAAASQVRALNATYQTDVTLARSDKAKALTVAQSAAQALAAAVAHPSVAPSKEAGLQQDKTEVTGWQQAITTAKAALWSTTLQLDQAWQTADTAYLKAAKNQQLVTHNHNLAELTAECAQVETDGGNQHAAGAVVLALTNQDAIAACADNLPMVSLAAARSQDQAWYWVIDAQQEFDASKVIVMGGAAGGNSYTYVSPFARYLAENAGSSYFDTEAIGVMAGNNVYDSAMAARAYADSGAIGSATQAMQFDTVGNLSASMMIPPTYALADGPYPYVVQGPASGSGGEAYALVWGSIKRQYPRLASLNPNRGPVGTVVTITGSSFGSRSGTVRFTEGTTVAIAPVSSWSTTEAVVTVPSGMTPGTAEVTVQRVGQTHTSPALPFTVTAVSSTSSGSSAGLTPQPAPGYTPPTQTPPGNTPPTQTPSNVCLDQDPGYLQGTNGQLSFDPKLCPIVVAYPGTGSAGNTAALAGEYVAQHTHSAVAGYVNGHPVTVAQMGTVPNTSGTDQPPTSQHGFVWRFLHWFGRWF